MRFKQILETTTAGSVATVAQPMMTQTRESVDVPGLKPVQQVIKGTKKKGPYANSVVEGKVKEITKDLKDLTSHQFQEKHKQSKSEVKADMKKVTEDDLSEQDLIVIPGQGRLKRTGFVSNDSKGNVVDKDLSSIDPDDHGETEGDFTKNQIHTMLRVLTHLEHAIGDEEDLPEWVQMKLSQAQQSVVGVMDYMISTKEREVERHTGHASLMKENGNQRVDSIVTDALQVMKGPEISDAVLALKRVLGDRAYNERRGFYSFYVDQIHDMYGQQGVEEGKPGLWANIHAKRERIKHGSGEHMRTPGSKGAPTADALRKSATEGMAEGLEPNREAAKTLQNLKNLALMKSALTFQQLRQAGRESMLTDAINACIQYEQSYLQNKQQGNAIFVRALRDEIDNFRKGYPINSSMPEDNAPELGDLLQGKLGKLNFQQGVAEGSLNELSSDLLQRAAQTATDKRNQAMEPKLHDALGGGYMNPLAKHYDNVSQKMDNRAAQVKRKETIQNIASKIASPVVMRKIGMNEGDVSTGNLQTMYNLARMAKNYCSDPEGKEALTELLRILKWYMDQGSEQGVAESDMYGDAEVSWEKGGRRAPTGAFRNPNFGNVLQKSVNKHNKALVQTKKDVGSRVADIGAGGKEHNVDTDAAWDAAKKKVSEGYKKK